MVSYLSWAANAVLFVVACFLAANTANTVFAAMLAPAGDQVEIRSTAEPADAKTWSERKIVLDRNLFKSSTVERSVADAAEMEEDMEATTLPLQLLGTAAADDPALAWAAIQDTEARKTLVVTLGDDLKGKATVMRIERRRIVLEENGKNRELTFGDEEQPAAAPQIARRPVARSRARAPRRDPKVRQLEENRFAMPREEIEEVLKDPTDVLSQARFLPKYDGKEMVGFQVNSIKQGSVLQDFGLKNGDLITEFNGIAIDDPTESAKLMREFSNSSQLRLVVEGADGESREINVDLDE